MKKKIKIILKILLIPTITILYFQNRFSYRRFQLRLDLIDYNKRHQLFNLTKNEPKYILFTKTHKTGSSTIQNILMRYALQHDKKLLWSKFTSPANNQRQLTSLHYPEHFKTNMALNQPGTVDLSCLHMYPKYPKQIYQMFPEDHNHNNNLFHFTILREPYSAYKSMFFYYKNENGNPCFSQNNFKDLRDLIENYEKCTRDIPGKTFPFFGNAAAFDLGYLATYSDEQDLVKRIPLILNELDQKLNLVLMLERYWESMILLKYALKLRTDEVVAFKLNSVLPPRSGTININKNEEAFYKNVLYNKILPVDSAIYNHFYQKFDEKIDLFKKIYGKEKLQQEIDELKAATDHFYNNICKAKELKPKNIDGSFDLKTQNIPREYVPWHPKNVGVKTILIGIDEGDVNFEDCTLKTLPEAELARRVFGEQVRRGLVETED